MTTEHESHEDVKTQLVNTMAINAEQEEEIRELGRDMLDKSYAMRKLKETVDTLQEQCAHMRREQINRYHSPAAHLHGTPPMSMRDIATSVSK